MKTKTRNNINSTPECTKRFSWRLFTDHNLHTIDLFLAHLQDNQQDDLKSCFAIFPVTSGLPNRALKIPSRHWVFAMKMLLQMFTKWFKSWQLYYSKKQFLVFIEFKILNTLPCISKLNRFLRQALYNTGW